MRIRRTLGFVISIAILALFKENPELRACPSCTNPRAAITGKSILKRPAKPIKNGSNKRKNTNSRTASGSNAASPRSSSPRRQGASLTDSNKASAGNGTAKPNQTTGTSRSQPPEKIQDRNEQLEQVNQPEPVPKGKDWNTTPPPADPPSTVNTKGVSSPQRSTGTTSRKPTRRLPRRNP